MFLDVWSVVIVLFRYIEYVGEVYTLLLIVIAFIFQIFILFNSIQCNATILQTVNARTRVCSILLFTFRDLHHTFAKFSNDLLVDIYDRLPRLSKCQKSKLNRCNRLLFIVVSFHIRLNKRKPIKLAIKQEKWINFFF